MATTINFCPSCGSPTGGADACPSCALDLAALIRQPRQPASHRRPGRPTKLDGRYQMKVREVDGRWTSIYGKTAKECQNRVGEARRRVEQGLPAKPDKITLCEYLTGHREWPAFEAGEALPPKGWLGNVAGLTVRPGAYARYEINIRCHIIPALGERRMARLTADEVQEFIADLTRSGLAPRTVSQVHAVLRNALNVAVERRQIPRNPAELAHVPRAAALEYRILDPSDAIYLLSRLGNDPLESIITLALTTGLREGELLGLTWPDVDMDAGLLHVRRQAQRVPGQGWTLPEPKSKTSRRAVILTELGIAALSRQRERVRRMKEIAAESGWDWDARWELVHPNEKGRPIEKGNLIRRWRRVLASAGLEYRTIHELRHSAANLLYRLGVAEKTIQEILGHSSIGVTAGIYMGSAPPLHADAMAALNRLLSAPSGGTPNDSSSISSSALVRFKPRGA